VPELPEVETVARSLRASILGRRILSVETSGLSLRRALDEKRLRAACAGARIETVERTGKYLLLRLSGGEVLVAHLGMSGRLLFERDGAARRLPHTHLVFRLDGGGELRYVDARRFGMIAVHAEGALAASPELSILGPDPLSKEFTLARFQGELSSSRRDVKQFLLDQGRVAGLGNIYVAEALFLAGISPRRRADRLGPRRGARLHRAIVEVLLAAVERRGTSFRDYVDADGQSGDNQHHLGVYGRAGAPCRRCGAPIRRLVQGARSTFYCPHCQR
jgi:formamidopyrimidine-DNA glycosylase